MAGTFTPKMLAEGQLATTKSTLYTVPVSTSAYMGILRIYNTTAVAQTVQLYLKPGSTSRKFRQINLQQDQAYELDMRGTTLPTGTLVEASTTTGTSVDYTLTGIEES